jgi:deoxyribose-phosphate aldolase
VQAGAAEIDMVLNVPALKKGGLRAVLQDIEAVVQAAGKAPVKVILETCLLTQDEKLIASALAKAAGAAFLKTSTGFSTGGATVEDVALLRSVARDAMGVKASGGVRSLPDALRMILAGASRIGTSNGPAILGKSSQEGESRVY